MADAQHEQDVADDRSGRCEAFDDLVEARAQRRSAMISSAALPNVAFRSPPTPSPVRLAELLRGPPTSTRQAG